MSDYCVYRIDCAATGKAYIGLTKVGAVRRFRDHKYLAANGGAGALYAAIRKHGADAFAVSVLEDGLGCEGACAREIALIAELSTKSPHGYNLCSGGKGAIGSPATADTRAKMSATHKARQADPALRARTSFALRGVPKSAEHNAKVAAANTGKTCPAETKAKLRAANLGKTQSAATISKRVAKLVGRKMPGHMRNRLGDASRGVPKSEDHRRKLSEALKGRPLSEAARANRAAALSRKREAAVAAG